MILHVILWILWSEINDDNQTENLRTISGDDSLVSKEGLEILTKTPEENDLFVYFTEIQVNIYM